jgi:hypothetical protein
MNRRRKILKSEPPKLELNKNEPPQDAPPDKTDIPPQKPSKKSIFRRFKESDRTKAEEHAKKVGGILKEVRSKKGNKILMVVLNSVK